MPSVPDPAAVQDAVDEVAIRGLIAHYADVVNRRTWAELGELFVPDAPVDLELGRDPASRLVGPTAVGDFIASALEQYPFFEFVALNVRVRLRDAGDPDRAAVRTYMCELRQDHDRRPSRAFGLYQDVVVRDGARRWRFAGRRYQSMGRGENGLEVLPRPATDW